MSEQLLPSDIDAEQATLGSVFLDRDAIIAVAPWLYPEHFFDNRHFVIYTAQLACFNRRVPPDIINVADELRRNGMLEKGGGITYLMQLSISTPTAVHVEYYARIVVRTARLRKLIQTGGKIAQIGYTTPELEKALLDAEAAFSEVTEQRHDSSAVHISKVLDAQFEQLQRVQQDQDALMGLPAGFRDLDELTGGFQKSDLIIVAARPSVGKSSMALSIAYNVALQQRASVGFFALEMSKDQLVQRILATHTGLNTQKIRTGHIRESDLQMVMDAMGLLATLGIYIDDTPGLSMSELRAKSRQLHMSVGLDLIIIDYLQLMQGGKKENRVQEVSEISRGLKALARELNIPVIALSQLSRAVEGRQNHVPMLSDLRESGSIEQDADIVMFIYREELYDEDTDQKGIAEIHLAKHRNGPIGVVPLRFFHGTTRFADLERYHEVRGY